MQNAFTRDVDALVSAFEDAEIHLRTMGNVSLLYTPRILLEKYLMPQSRMSLLEENSNLMSSPQKD